MVLLLLMWKTKVCEMTILMHRQAIQILWKLGVLEHKVFWVGLFWNNPYMLLMIGSRERVAWWFGFFTSLWIASYVSQEFLCLSFYLSYSNLHIQLNVFWRHFHLFMICRLYSLMKTHSNLKYLVDKGFRWIKLIFRNGLNCGISLIYFASVRTVWVNHKYQGISASFSN